MAYRDFKDLNRRTFADKVSRDKVLPSGSGIKNQSISDKELWEEFHKPVIRKFDKRKVHSPFTGNIWGADLADIQLISKCNKEYRLLWVIDIYSKYAWVIPLKDKKGITISNT